MVDYRYRTRDLRTGAVLGELPLSNVRYGHALNAAGTCTARLTLGRRAASGRSLDRIFLDAVEPARTALYVEREGVVVWGGIIWTHDYDSTNRSLGIRAAEFWSYFRARRLRVDMDIFPAIDQFDIVRQLITWAQSQPGGSIGVQLDTMLSGVTRDPEWFGYQRLNIGRTIEQMAASEDGFDFAIDVATDPENPVATLHLANRRGRIAGESGHVFEYGRNVGSYRSTLDATGSANSIDAIGNGEGDSMLLYTATDTALVAAGYPLLDDTVSYKDIDDDALIEGKAREAVRARAHPVETVQLVNVRPDGDPPLGSWIMGDDARVRITDHRYPEQADGSAGLDRYMRIIGDEVAVTDQGVETVTLTMEASNG